MRFPRWSGVFAVVLLFCGSCSHSSDDSLESDINLYQRNIWQATERHTADCMKQLGFDYQEEPFEQSDNSVPGLSPYALTLDQAEGQGFGFVDATLGSVVPEAGGTLESSSSTSSSYDAALFGDGTGTSGCRAEAQQEAYQEVNLDRYPAIQHREQIVSRIEDDPRYAAFWQSWSGCMAEKGITTMDLDSLQVDYADRAAKLVQMQDPVIDQTTGAVLSPPSSTIDYAAADELRGQEIAAAVASVQCLEPLRDQWDQILDDAQK